MAHAERKPYQGLIEQLDEVNLGPVFGPTRWLFQATELEYSRDNQAAIASINQQLESEAVVLLAGHHDKADIGRMLVALAEHINCAQQVIVPVSYLGYRHEVMKTEIIDRLYTGVTDHLDARQMAWAMQPENNPYGIEIYSAWRPFEEDRFQAGEITAEQKDRAQALFKLYVKRTQPIFRQPDQYPGTLLVVAPSARMTPKGEQSLDLLYKKLEHGIALYCMALEWTPEMAAPLLAQVNLYAHQWRLNQPETYSHTADWQPPSETSLARANQELNQIFENLESDDANIVRKLLVQAGTVCINPEQISRDLETLKKAMLGQVQRRT